MSPRIYLAYFQNTFLVQSEILTPIQVGRTNSATKLEMIGDDTGQNISRKNSSYCEMTAHYWAWKNDKESSHIGFLHYRRFLDFRFETYRSNDSVHGIVEDFITNDLLEEYGLTDESISEAISRYDLILPTAYNVGSLGFRSVEQQYISSPEHHRRDFQIARAVVRELSPAFRPYFERMARGRLLYPANMFVASRELFHEYAEWIFPILAEIDKRLDTKDYSIAGKRAVGYLAERLTTTFMLKKLEELPSHRVKHTSRIFVQDTVPLPITPPIPDTKLPFVSVVASSDAAYLPHLGALIASVFDNASHSRFVDFVVLDAGIGKIGRKNLQELTRLHPHCSIQFVDLSRRFLDLPLHYYFTRATFLRLSMPDVLSNRDKVLFLDTDMVALDDVCKVFDVELEGHYVGAAKDLVMSAFRAKGVRSIAESGAKPAEVYLSEILQMGRRTSDYFQAGTIVFDLQKFRDDGAHEKMIRDLEVNRYWFLDQDVLNKHLIGKVKFLDHRWNAVYLDDSHYSCLNSDNKLAYDNSLENPAIAHFAGIEKPWRNFDHPLSSHYWKYLRKTHWYEKVIVELIKKVPEDIPTRFQRNPPLVRRLVIPIWRAMPNVLKRAILPMAIKIDRKLGAR